MADRSEAYHGVDSINDMSSMDIIIPVNPDYPPRLEMEDEASFELPYSSCNDDAENDDISDGRNYTTSKGNRHLANSGSATKLDSKELRSSSVISKGAVRFTTVQIREYAITLGDHPLSQMYPLSLDWTYNVLEETDVNADQEKFSHKEIDYKKAFRKVSRMGVIQRLARLVEVTGRSDEELFTLEQQRKLRLTKERYNGFLYRNFPVVTNTGISLLKVSSHHEQRLKQFRSKSGQQEYHIVVC